MYCIAINFVELKNIARYEKVTATSLEEAEEKLLEFDDADIVELEIQQSEPLSASSLKALRKDFACVSNVTLVRTLSDGESKSSTKRKFLSDEELFTEFYESVRGFKPSEDLVKMFIDCKGGSDETN